jgi:hypothetical protein
MQITIDKKRGIIIATTLALALVGVVVAQSLLTGNIGTITVTLAPGLLNFVGTNSFNGQTCIISPDKLSLTCPPSAAYQGGVLAVSFNVQNVGQQGVTPANGLVWTSTQLSQMTFAGGVAQGSQKGNPIDPAATQAFAGTITLSNTFTGTISDLAVSIS